MQTYINMCIYIYIFVHTCSLFVVGWDGESIGDIVLLIQWRVFCLVFWECFAFAWLLEWLCKCSRSISFAVEQFCVSACSTIQMATLPKATSHHPSPCMQPAPFPDPTSVVRWGLSILCWSFAKRQTIFKRPWNPDHAWSLLVFRICACHFDFIFCSSYSPVSNVSNDVVWSTQLVSGIEPLPHLQHVHYKCYSCFLVFQSPKQSGAHVFFGQ